jgi:hypothetical protein
VLTNYLQAAIHLPPVVIGDFKDEKVFEHVAVVHGISGAGQSAKDSV